MEGRDPTEFTLREKATFVAQGVMSGKIFELAKPANVSLWKELSSSFHATGSEGDARAGNGGRDRAGTPRIPDGEPRLRAARVSPFREIHPANSQGNIVESMQALSGIVPILVMLAPYIYAFHSQAPSRRWLREICLRAHRRNPAALKNRKRAWFTDTLEDVNGVATTIRKMTAPARPRAKN